MLYTWRATGHSAYLASWVHGQATITDLVEGRASPYLEDLEPGLPAAAHATAAGKALLATLPNARRRQYLGEQGMPTFTADAAHEPFADCVRRWRRPPSVPTVPVPEWDGW